MLDKIKREAAAAAAELCETANLKKGALFVVGCSSSEIAGKRIGTDSNLDVAEAAFDGIYEELSSRGIYLAAQCCEHLNRALIVERAALPGAEEVCVVPKKKAGGSFATTAYLKFKDPIAVEKISADAGIDIGGTFIGMHLKHVAVPVRLVNNRIGETLVTAARTRPKYIGGERAEYK